MKYLLLTLILLSGSLAFAQQVSVKPVQETDPRFKDRNNTFPLIEIAGDDKTAGIINEYLQKDFLDVKDSSARQGSIFDNVDPSSEDEQRTTLKDISYEVRCNKNKLLSLAISATGCGAYCEDYTTYYSFDIKNGNRLWLDTLLRPEFKHLLLDTLNARKKDLLTKKIAWINDTLKTEEPWKSDDDPAYYTDMRRLYQDCLQDEKKDFSFVRFYLSREQFYIELDRCSAHVNRNLDELDAFGFYFNVSAWKQYFTDYALQLVQHSNVVWQAKTEQLELHSHLHAGD